MDKCDYCERDILSGEWRLHPPGKNDPLTICEQCTELLFHQVMDEPVVQ
jgi:hypothetical protein